MNTDNREPLESLGTQTFRVYAVTSVLTAFKEWYADVFSAQNPTASTAFQFTKTETADGELVEELSSYHELLSIDALESLFYAYQDDMAKNGTSVFAKNTTLS